MKCKFKKFWEKYDALVLGVLALFILFWVPVGIHLSNRYNNPTDPTSEKGIEAKSFEYKGHQYILFEKTNLFGQISIVHDPDCNKCK